MNCPNIITVSFIFLLLLPRSVSAQTKPYRGAEYRTIGTMIYGRFEVRMRSAPVSGMLASFFTYYDPASPWNEIDIENLGRYTTEVQLTTIVPTQAEFHVQRQTIPFNPHGGFHVYGIEWTPDYVAWQIDGDEVYRQTASYVAQLTKPQKVMMNIWQSTNVDWAGLFNASQLPVYAYYDWVKYSSYTPGSGDNFTLQWTDNFTTFDTQRWQKATHTWNENNAQFVTENAVLKDGYLILCLTSNTTSGYAGGAVPDVDTDPPFPVGAWGYDSTIVIRFSESVDAVTAQSVASYFGGAVAYKNALLRADQRTVDIGVSGMDLATPFIMFSQGVKDLATPANTMGLNPVRVVMPLTFPIKIDLGGPGGGGYLADSAWTATKQYGYIGGAPFLLPAGTPIANTSEPAIYRSSIHGISGYKVRVPNGRYKVTFLLAEDKFTTQGKRIFSAKAEGHPVFADLDLFSQAGFATAVAVVAPAVDVADNMLDLWLGASIDSTTVSGIVIDRASGATGIRQEPVRTQDTDLSIFPNPMNASAVFHIVRAQSGPAAITIRDLLGRTVSTLDLTALTVGTHDVRWSASAFASGVYYCTLTGEASTITKKVLLLR
jgi:hypothetical protein